MALRGPSTILVYCGKGSNKRSRHLLLYSLEAVVDLKQYSVRYVTSEQIKEGSWMRTCRLIAFGGGYDLGFESALGKEGVKQISKFVQNGGSYLGICAGAYWACDYIEFDKGGPLEVTGERFLKFYPGLCVGPAFPGFQYTSRAGVHAVPVSYKGMKDFHAYFEGGGFFKSCTHSIKVQDVSSRATQHVSRSEDGQSQLPPSSCLLHEHNGHDTDISSHVETLGTYSSLANQPPAIVKCRQGHGQAILSGVHVEFPVQLLDREDLVMRNCLPQLFNSENDRLLVFKDILGLLEIKCMEQGKL